VLNSAFDVKPLAELVHWGDIIDGAQYTPPRNLRWPFSEPATAIGSGDRSGAGKTGWCQKLLFRICPHRPLAEMIKLPIVARHLGPLLERHHRVDRI